MDIWMVLLRVLVGIVAFFTLFLVLWGVAWVFEKLLNLIRESSLGNVMDKIFYILRNFFVILALIVFVVLLICFMYETGDVLWKLI